MNDLEALWEAEYVAQLGVDVETGVEIGVDIPVDALLHDHDAIVLACGMGDVPALGIDIRRLITRHGSDDRHLLSSQKLGKPLPSRCTSTSVRNGSNRRSSMSRRRPQTRTTRDARPL